MKKLSFVLVCMFISGQAFAGFIGQDQHQRQSQSQSSQSASNQTASVSQTNNVPEAKWYLTQAAPGVGYAPGNSGMTAYTPFGGLSNSDVAEVNKLKIASEILGVDEVKDQMREAIKPCRLFSVGPKRFDLGLGGFLCWPTQRK